MPEFTPNRLHPRDLSDLKSNLASKLDGLGGGRFGGRLADGSAGSSVGFGAASHRYRALEGGYGRLPASDTQNVAAIGAFTSTFSFEQDIEDGMLYLNDDSGAVQDITSLVIGKRTLTLAGALPASTMRDTGSNTNDPVRGYYIGRINGTTNITITGNTKIANAIFGFYILGKYEGDGMVQTGFANARLPQPRE